MSIVSYQSDTCLLTYRLASVIVPWWDHTDLLCFWEHNLEHLQDAEIIFIDNGSTPKSQVELQEFCQRHRLKLIRNETNLGYAAANNQGAQAAIGEYLLFLNNDIEILKPPVQYLCTLAGEGISGPGPFLTETQEICIEGWALCIKKTTLNSIGNWCEDYGAGYWDDVDLCYRAVLNGYPLHHSSEFLSGNWQAPSSSHALESSYIYHLGGTTGADGRLKKQVLHDRNRQLFTQKFYPQLREINAIVFPDWHQPEDILYSELAQVIRAMQSHPAYERLSLVVDSGTLSDEDADLILSGIVMSLLLENNLRTDTEPTISILTKFQQSYWLPWRYRLHFRLILPHENELAIVDRGADLPAVSIEAFQQG